MYVDRDSSGVTHGVFADLVDLLNPGDLLVLNDTRVIPARLYGRKQSGGKVEVLLERVLDQSRLLAQVRASKSPPNGVQILIDGADSGQVLEVSGRQGEFFELQVHGVDDLDAWLLHVGHMPLPPYIKRADTVADAERYQTVYAEQAGAVAAPTAGLHFDEDTFEALQMRGISLAKVTLHVGAGTFQPVRVQNIDEHKMHVERYHVSQACVDSIQNTQRAGGRVIAVGTTSVRALESAVSGGTICAGSGDTDIFISPGYRFHVVDALLTNFHLPGSTLIMLVSAFAGYKLTMTAYAEAVRERYRFFSYGDAMFIS